MAHSGDVGGDFPHGQRGSLAELLTIADVSRDDKAIVLAWMQTSMKVVFEVEHMDIET